MPWFRSNAQAKNRLARPRRPTPLDSIGRAAGGSCHSLRGSTRPMPQTFDTSRSPGFRTPYLGLKPTTPEPDYTAIRSKAQQHLRPESWMFILMAAVTSQGVRRDHQPATMRRASWHLMQARQVKGLGFTNFLGRLDPTIRPRAERRRLHQNLAYGVCELIGQNLEERLKSPFERGNRRPSCRVRR